jgi:hypothetical protein
MGSTKSKAKKCAESEQAIKKEVDNYINYIKRYYPTEWAVLNESYSLDCIKTKCQNIYLTDKRGPVIDATISQQSIGGFDHMEYTCFVAGYETWRFSRNLASF